MNSIFLFSLPIMTAFIGWLTNLVAIKMLFRPMKGVTVLGYTWQGIIPKRQKDLAARTAAIIEKELLDSRLLEHQIKRIDLKPYLRDYARKLVHEGLGDKLRRVPIFGGFADSSRLVRLENLLTDEMQKQATPLLHRLSTEVEKHIPVKELVEEKIRTLEVEKLERIVNQVARKEFRSIELLGGVLGFLVGLAQLLMLYLTGNLEL
jgi:uncharacterized membrane protein YheB (UPF0754 family)